jgi:hypothetical protein
MGLFEFLNDSIITLESSAIISVYTCFGLELVTIKQYERSRVTEQ